jgi:hypothetical protein
MDLVASLRVTRDRRPTAQYLVIGVGSDDENRFSQRRVAG